MSLIYPLPDNEALADRLADGLGWDRGHCRVRNFPDGETWVRVLDDCEDRDVAVAATLDRPDTHLAALIFMAETLRDLGARRVGLVAPYLAYMRQDERFQPGEGVTSRYFARLLSGLFDWLVTVDPHLHRHDTLDQLYSIPTRIAHSADAVAAWLDQHVEAPFLVGPDEESEQWTARVADAAGVPFVTLEKERRGDRDVEVQSADLSEFTGRTPVLFDDIISTGHTMVETVRQVRQAGFAAPICVGIHAVFAEDAAAALREAGAAQIVTCDTIEHPSNAIETHDILVESVTSLTAGGFSR